MMEKRLAKKFYNGLSPIHRHMKFEELPDNINPNELLHDMVEEDLNAVGDDLSHYDWDTEVVPVINRIIKFYNKMADNNSKYKIIGEKMRVKYDTLVEEIEDMLRNMVEDSNYVSEWVDEKALNLTQSRYKELTIINNRLIFLDERGLQYSLHTLPLEEVIEIFDEDLN